MNSRIRDEDFIRGNVPMTKEEVRTLSISKLQLLNDSVLLDIGSGSGSIAITADRVITKGMVYAVEANKGAIELIKQNITKLGATGINLIQGMAPECLPDDLSFTHAFVGGSGGKLSDILTYIKNHIQPPGVVVVNAIDHNTVYRAFNFFLENHFIQIENTLVNIAKSEIVKNSVLYKANNPVNIISAIWRN